MAITDERLKTVSHHRLYINLLHTTLNFCRDPYTYLLLLACVLTNVILFLPNILNNWYGFDCGMFLLGAKDVSQGLALYQDSWDHKSPLITFINCLFIWGPFRPIVNLFIFQTVSTYISSVLAYRFVRRHIEPLSSFLIVAFVLFWLLKVQEEPNSLGLWAVLPSVLALYMIFNSDLRISPYNIHIISLVSGCLFSFIFWLRPTLAGFLFVSSAFLIVTACSRFSFKQSLLRFSYFLIGAIIVSAPLFLYSLYNHILPQAYHATWSYNIDYASGSQMGHRGLISKLSVLFATIVRPGVLLGYIIIFSALLLKQLRKYNNNLYNIKMKIFYIISTVVTFALTFGTSVFLYHYQAAMVPILVLAFTLTLAKLYEKFNSRAIRASLVLLLIIQMIISSIGYLSSYRERQVSTRKLEHALTSTTHKHKYKYIVFGRYDAQMQAYLDLNVKRVSRYRWTGHVLSPSLAQEAIPEVVKHIRSGNSGFILHLDTKLIKDLDILLDYSYIPEAKWLYDQLSRASAKGTRILDGSDTWIIYYPEPVPIFSMWSAPGN